MRALEKIRELLQERLPTIHRKRIEALMAAVEALMTGGRIACSELGRHVSPASSHKHGIKRIDRLLGNTALHGELSDIYRAMAGILVGRHKCPVILIDWTEIGRERCALVAALALDGRAVPVYSEAHPVRDLSSRRVL